MGRPLQQLQRFFRELKRRNVYKVTATYAVVAFLGFQAAKLLIPSTVLPGWTDEFFLFLLVIGFPVVLVVAWAFELTPEGVRRTPARSGRPSPGDDTADAGEVARSRRAAEVDPEQTPGIAVLPFEDMSPEGDQQYFGDGLAEELLDALAGVEGLRVAARTSSYAFRDRAATVQEIGERLGVSHLLEGSVRKAGDRLRVTAQLVDANDGYHLWSETFDQTASDVFEIQDEITRSVVDNLEGTLLAGGADSPENRPGIADAGTDDPEAHDRYLKGKYYWYHRFRFGLETAIECFQQAIEVDPGFAQPYTGLADAYTVTALYRHAPPDQLREPTRKAIYRALELEPELGEAWHSKGLYRAFFDAEWRGAIEAFRRAAELNPNSGRHPVWIGFLGLYLQEPPEEVHEQLSRAEELEPRSDYILAVLGLAAVLDRRYDDAVEFGDRALEVEPEAFFGWLTKGAGLLHRGEGEAGLEAIERAADLAQRTPFVLSMLGSAAARVDRPGRTTTILQELEVRSEEEFVAPLFTGMLKGALGRADEALHDLEQEREEYGASAFPFLGLHLWPALDEEPRYRRMLAEAGLHFPPAESAGIGA